MIIIILMIFMQASVSFHKMHWPKLLEMTYKACLSYLKILRISSAVANTSLEDFCYLRHLIIEQQLIIIYLKYCCYLFDID